MKPFVAITIGDFNGVGPEVALKSVTSPSVRKACHPILIGPLEIYQWYAKRLGMKIRFNPTDSTEAVRNGRSIPVTDLGIFHVRDVQPGKLSPIAGTAAALALQKGAALCLSKRVSAIVTSPVSKEALHLAGYLYPGQTEMLAELTESEHVTMMLVSDRLRVGLVTVHVPLRQVPELLSIEKVFESLINVYSALQRDLGIQYPQIAVLGLNPHAGENGLIGAEELKVISPAVELARTQGLPVKGPFSSDAFFGNYQPKKYDGVVAMYHDQGLIPLKMSSSGRAVNYSAGLKIIRTSPDHGTAFDIAGKGIANSRSMVEAILLAVQVANRRRACTPKCVSARRRASRLTHRQANKTRKLAQPQ